MTTAAGNPARLASALRSALPWLLLMLVSATGARAMQVGVESIGTSVEPLGSRSAPMSTAAGPPVEDRSTVVLVSYVDARGNQAEFHCSTTADRVTADSLFLNLEDVSEVVPNLCDAIWT